MHKEAPDIQFQDVGFSLVFLGTLLYETTHTHYAKMGSFSSTASISILHKLIFKIGM